MLSATVSTSGVLAEENRRVAVRRFADARKPPTRDRLAIGGFLASAKLRTATRRVLLGEHAAGADRRAELQPAVQLHDHRPRRHPGAPRGPGGDLAVTGAGGVAPAALDDVRATPACARLVALTPMSSARARRLRRRRPGAILSGGEGGGFDAGVSAGSSPTCPRR